MTGLIAEAASQFGGLDVMINNAGLGGTSSVLEMTDEEWLRVLDITLNGTFRCTRAALRQMVAQGRRRCRRQQRLGARLARAGRSGALCRGQGRRDGADKVRRHGRGQLRHPGQRGRAEPGHASVPDQGDERRSARRARRAREAFGRGAEPWEVATVIVVPGQRLLDLPDRRGHLGQQPAPLTSGWA